MDFSNPSRAQWYQTTVLYALLFEKKKEKTVPFRVKNPLEMHSTDALHLKTPCPFPSGNKSAPQRENTAFFMNTAIIRQNTHVITCTM